LSWFVLQHLIIGIHFTTFHFALCNFFRANNFFEWQHFARKTSFFYAAEITFWARNFAEMTVVLNLEISPKLRFWTLLEFLVQSSSLKLRLIIS